MVLKTVLTVYATGTRFLFLFLFFKAFIQLSIVVLVPAMSHDIQMEILPCNLCTVIYAVEPLYGLFKRVKDIQHCEESLVYIVIVATGLNMYKPALSSLFS